MVLERGQDGWNIRSSFGLQKAQQNQIRAYLRVPEVEGWVSGAVSVGRNRWRSTPVELAGLGNDMLYLIPVRERPVSLLVGSGALERQDQNLWRVQAAGIADWIDIRGQSQGIEAEAAVMREELCAVDQLVQSLIHSEDLDQVSLFLMRKLVALFDPQCAELSYRFDGQWHWISYECTHQADLQVETQGEPARQPVQGAGQLLLLRSGGQEYGYLRAEPRPGRLWTNSRALSLEIFANLMACVLRDHPTGLALQ